MTNTLNFAFPESDDEQFQFVRDLDDLKSKINVRAKDVVGGNPLKMYRMRLFKGRYLYAECKFTHCKAVMKYQKDSNSRYKLSQIVRYHTHPTTKSNIAQSIEKFMRQHSNNMSIGDLKEYMTQKFGLTDSSFYYYHKKYVEEATGFKSLLMNLKSTGYYVDCIPKIQQLSDDSDELPDMIIIVSQTMKEAYRHFGQFIAFDVTYNVFRDKKQVTLANGQKRTLRWGLGMMIGKNNHNKITPFGICITNNETVDAFAYMFAQFFNIMGKVPEVVLSDQQITIQQALRKLQQENIWDGAHLFDMFHLLRNIRFKIKNKQIFSHLRKALSATSIDQFEECVGMAKNNANDQIQMSVVQEFIRYSPRYCICKTPPKFSGITISTSFAQKTNDLIKRAIPYEKKCYVGVSRIIKTMEDIHEKSHNFALCKNTYENTFSNNELKQIRLSVCETIMETFIKRYAKALPIDFSTISEDRMIYEGQHEKYTVLYNNKTQRWDCSCQQILKTGLPCAHQIKACLIKGADLIDYIHKRWMITPKQQEALRFKYMQMMPRGRPKLSRRRAMRN